MSKKADKKTGAKLPELVIDPECKEKEELKKREAYEMVQRAMIRSQVRTQRRFFFPSRVFKRELDCVYISCWLLVSPLLHYSFGEEALAY